MTKKQHLSDLAPSALLIGLQLGLFSVWHVYNGNQAEFVHGLLDMAPIFLLVSAFLTAFLAFAPLALPARTQRRTVALFTAVGLLLFFQSTFLVWNYGVFDGEEVRWSAHTTKGWGELLLWASVLLWAFLRPHFLVRQSRFFCLMIVVIQLGTLTFTAAKRDGDYWRHEGSQAGAPPAAVYEYSQSHNVIHVILDAFQTDVFEELVAEEKLRPRLDGFVLYRDNVGVTAHTVFAVPAFLSGETYSGNESPSQYYRRCINELAFPNRLHEAGYRVNLLPRTQMNNSQYDNIFRVPDTFDSNPGFRQRQAAWHLLDVGLFRQAPHFAKKAIHNQGQWFLSGLLSTPPAHRSTHQRAFLRDYIAKIDPVLTEPTYNFIHIMSPHPPYAVFADGRPADGPLPLVRENYKHEARYTLGAFMEFIPRLKALGIYDSSLIVLQGDHGVNFPPVVNGITINLPVGRAPALLAVKLPGESGPLRISEAPTTITDVPATVMSALHLTHDYPGTPLAQLDENTARTRIFFQNIGHDLDDPVIRRYQLEGSVFEPAGWHLLGDFKITRSEANYTWGDRLQFGMQGNAAPYHAHGWSPPSPHAQWSDGKQSELQFLIEKTNEDVVFIITMRPFIAPGKVDRQRVRVMVNGRDLSTFSLDTDSINKYKLVIPAEMIDTTELVITFGLPDAAVPAELGISGDQRELGISIISTWLFPQAMAGEMASRIPRDPPTILPASLAVPTGQ